VWTTLLPICARMVCALWFVPVWRAWLFCTPSKGEHYAEEELSATLTVEHAALGSIAIGQAVLETPLVGFWVRAWKKLCGNGCSWRVAVPLCRRIGRYFCVEYWAVFR
jgi:hypothetical protein